MSFATKYRPTGLSGIVGQSHIVRSLEKLFAGAERPQTFLFHGRSGTGKTSLARVVALLAGADPSAIDEVNAANRTGVEDWRKQLETLQHMPQKGDVRAIIVDECQALSPSSWKLLLKPTEDVPAHVVWIFCTTDLVKVPETLVTRAIEYPVKDCGPDELSELIASVWADEDPETAAEGSFRTDAIWELVRYAQGSPRQALTGLETVIGAESIDQVKALLSRARPPQPVIDLIRALVSGRANLRQAVKMVQGLGPGVDPESVRRALLKYTVKVIMSDRTPDANLPRLTRMLDHFSVPYADRHSVAPLLASIGKALT